MTPTILLAFGLAFASAAAAYGGSAMQAFEARKVPKSEALRFALLLELIRRPVWIGGTLLNIAAFGGQVVALSLASLAIVQPTFALGLVVLVVIAAWKLSERVGLLEVGGIAAIIAGLVGLAFVAPRHDHLPENTATALTLAATLAAIVCVLGMMRLAGFSGGFVSSIAAGITYAWLSFAGTLLGEAFTHHRWWSVVVITAATIASAVLAVGVEMTALQTWSVTRSKPVVFVLQTLIPALGAPFFSAHGFGPAHGIPFACSLAVVTGGAALVASSAAVAATQR